ncbi:MAG: thioredoxin family protein [Epsilonproteobacteria bacterium]|nr:thioredoxin family protein [Campylobacterota bacterium]
MRALAILLLSLLTLSGHQWYTDFDKALAQAKREKTPLFVFMERHNPPCRWCQKMWRRTLTDPKIARYLSEHFITVRLAREEHNYPPTLSARFVPTIFIVDPKGEVIKKIIGYWSAEDFWSDLRDIERLLTEK